ncbi:hypothetical protein [Synechocystis sp. FACHB-383]|nr:hypothetical protein [Synechocystis sp. FACHB-383]
MGDTHLLDADALICLGTVEQLRTLNQLLCPLNPAPVRLPKNHR